MALFDLKCTECEKEFQKMVAFSKLPEVTCPQCGSTRHERVYKANIKGPVSSSGGTGGGYSAPRSSGFT